MIATSLNWTVEGFFYFWRDRWWIPPGLWHRDGKMLWGGKKWRKQLVSELLADSSCGKIMLDGTQSHPCISYGEKIWWRSLNQIEQQPFSVLLRTLATFSSCSSLSCNFTNDDNLLQNFSPPQQNFFYSYRYVVWTNQEKVIKIWLENFIEFRK